METILALDPGVEIPLTQGFVAIVDAVDVDLVSQFSWRVQKHRHTKYAIRSWCDDDGIVRTQNMHGLIMNAIGIDHVNGNGLDNRRTNLRLATQTQNNGNMRKTRGSSQYKGVSWNIHTKRWRAKVKHNYISYNLGEYDIEIEAALAYDVKAKELFGEFARTNF